MSRLRSAPNTDISTGGGQTAVARRKEQLLTALGIIVRYPAGTPTVPRDVEDAERRVFDLVGVLALSASQTAGFDPVAIYVFGHLVECGFVERLLYIRLIPRDQLKAEGVLCHHSDISLPLLEALRRLAVGAKVVVPKVGQIVPIDPMRLARLQRQQYMKAEFAAAMMAYLKSLPK